MLNRDQRELISAGLDGELTSRERREHDALLAASAEARALQAELRSVGGALETLPEVAPPSDLAERVLTQATPRRASVTPIRSRWRRVQLPLAFAAGLLAAVVVQRLLPPAAPEDQQWMSGTLAPASKLPGLTGHRIDTEGLHGQVSLGQRDGARALEFRLQASAPLEIEVDLEGTGRSFGGVVSVDEVPGVDARRIEFAGGTVRVVGDGAAAFGLLLPAMATGAGQGGAIRVAIHSGGEIRYEATFED
jgi:hypothetical protein